MKETSMSRGHGLGLFRDYHYIPCDLEKESVSKTLEYAYDDWCIAQMAKALNKEDRLPVFLGILQELQESVRSLNRTHAGQACRWKLENPVLTICINP